LRVASGASVWLALLALLAGPLIAAAERAMADAGFDLISVMSWRERFKNRVFPISRWEGHPNELAHSLIAKQLHERLLAHDELRAYAIAGPGESHAGARTTTRNGRPGSSRRRRDGCRRRACAAACRDGCEKAVNRPRSFR
jgi:hypothetical protein